jgi:hypothetical protein
MLTARHRGLRTATTLLVLTGLGACATGGDERPVSARSASASPSATVSRAVPSPTGTTMAQAEAALPARPEVRGADDQGFRCRAGRTNHRCPQQPGTTYASVRFTLNGTASEADPEQGEGTPWQPEEATLTVYRYADAATARRSLHQARWGAARYAGDVRQEAKRFARDRYQLGARGRSTFSPRGEAGRPGYGVRTTRRLTTPNGTTSSPQETGQVAVGVGRFVVFTSVALWADRHPDGTAARMARTLTAQYVHRLAG